MNAKKYLNFKLWSLTLFFFCVFTSPAKAQQFTLESAVTRALAANPTIEAKKLAIDRAWHNIGIAQSPFWPRLSFSSGHEKLDNTGGVGTSADYSNRSRYSGFQASLSLFAGFAHLNQLEKSIIAKEMAQEEHSLASMELVANVQGTFISLLKARDDLRHAHNSLRRIEKQLESAKAFVKVDMAPQLDVLQNEADLAAMQQNAFKAENEIRNSTIQLNHLLGFLPHENVEYIGKLEAYGKGVEYGEEDSIRLAMTSRPDLRVAQSAIKVALKDSHIAAGSFLPKVDLVYNNTHFHRNYSERFLDDYSRDYWSIALTFSWDFFEGGHTTFSTLSERKRIEALKKDYEDTVSRARKEIIRAMLDILTADKLIGSAKAGIKAAREGYRMAEKRYATGTGTITELLEAQARLSRAESDLINAYAEYQTARVRYYFHIGKENHNLK